ncbi:hypothetical protein B5807_04851 [Epicoccum nigrum]|uniref:Uncharacterized protein n=1 Tax=Epicoccum nigrum TaxID=105696 RepID=A0A1Y2M2Z3_EPING|nr:hypothetical protein B5807_04851 [Epicoccum nigrum]
MIELYLGDLNASLTVMSRGKRFHIFIVMDDFCGKQGDALVQTFLDYKKNMGDDPCAMEEFQEWMVRPCISHMEHFKPPTPRAAPLSLTEYLAPETVVLKLVNAEGSLEATMCPGNTPDTHSSTPRVALSDPTV